MSTNQGAISQGSDYIKFYDEVGSLAQAQTRAVIETGGTRLPDTYAKLGTVLGLLELAACCHWGCANGDHQFERLAARVHNLAMGSLRLIDVGLYDEAILMIRSIGEIANLLMLFVADPPKAADWRSSDRKKRIRQYGPGAVRDAISALNHVVPMDTDTYQLFCEHAAHPVPDVRPNALNQSERPVLIGWVQSVGVVASLNELGGAVGAATGTLAVFLPIPVEARQKIKNASVDLLRSIGGVNMSNWRDSQTRATETSEFPKPTTQSS